MKFDFQALEGEVHWEAFNPRWGLRVIITIVLGAVLGDLIGAAAPIIALSVLVVSMVESHGPLRERMINQLGFTLFLTIITGIAWVVTGDMWPVAITIFLVTLLGGLAQCHWLSGALKL